MFRIHYKILLLLQLSAVYILPQDSANERIIHLVQQAWHVGYLIPVNSTTINYIPVLNEFRDYKYVDVGWGDEDFYQNDGINYYYGAKAMLIPTSSVIKITAHKASKQSILGWHEDYRKISLMYQEYVKLLKYIGASFLKEDNAYIETSSHAEGAIRYYKSHLSYYLFNTCNTWIARGLHSAGINIDYSGVITKDQLFAEVDDYIINKNPRKSRGASSVEN